MIGYAFQLPLIYEWVGTRDSSRTSVSKIMAIYNPPAPLWRYIQTFGWNLWGAVLLFYSAFLGIKKSISWYQEIFFDIKNSIYWYQEIKLLISKNRILDIKKSISWYREEFISWYQEIKLFISRIIYYYLISRNRILDSRIRSHDIKN